MFYIFLKIILLVSKIYLKTHHLYKVKPAKHYLTNRKMRKLFLWDKCTHESPSEWKREGKDGIL